MYRSESFAPQEDAMNGSYRGGPSDARSQSGASRAGWGLKAAMDSLWDSFEQRTARPAESTGGDVRAAVLSVLLDGPMHGSQIIRAITDRSAGTWRPTAGAVYPTLLLLADEGLLAPEETAGRKTYSLTDLGRAEAQAAQTGADAWGAPGATDRGRPGSIPRAGAQLAQAAAQVARSGSPEQIADAVAALDEARRTLYSILARP
jgi:DNA-binding PadR family transcriptional regulator